jgi:putative hydrolase of the HAD superfamily
MGKENVCVVFDLDDTLYMERDYVRSGFDAVDTWCLERMGMRGIKTRAQSLFDQGRRGDIFDAVLTKQGFSHDPGKVAAMVQVYREHAPVIELLPDAAECLKRLLGRVHMGLLTDGNSATQWAKIDALSLRDCFDAIAVTGDWGAEFFKPHLRGYVYMEARFQACCDRYVYVADNPAKDFSAPHALGWNAVRVRRPGGFHEGRECPDEFGCFEVSSLESLPAVLSSLYRIAV